MDLKAFREDKLKITQAVFAELIGVEQSDIARWEKDPGSISLHTIQRIMEVTGVSFGDITNHEKPTPKGLEVENNWNKADMIKRSFTDYIASVLNNAYVLDEQRKAYIDDIHNGLSNIIVKTKIAIVGRSDTGKSTMINALLGADKMPAEFTPTTSIAIYIKHISDMPEFIEDEVWVFANPDGNGEIWNERRLYDEDYCRSWKIGAGEADILCSFAIRQGENYNSGANAAVIFLDSPILNACDIIDMPGFGTEENNDDKIAFKVARSADVIIYLSQANGFMRIEDMTYLKRNINELPVWEKRDENKLKPLANIFIVASQAHVVNHGNRVQLEKILESGCSRFLKTLPEEYWDGRKNASGYDYSGYGNRELRSRFFAYTTDIPDICRPFHAVLQEELSALPLIIANKAQKFVREYVKMRKPNLINEIQRYENLVTERDKYISLLQEIKSNELSRIQDNDKRKSEVRTEIHRLKNESIKEFSEYISENINTDSLVKLMEDKGIMNKRDDIEMFGSYLQSMLQQRCNSILSIKTRILSKKTKEYITAYSESFSSAFSRSTIKFDFDLDRDFVSKLLMYGLGGALGGMMPAIAGILARIGIMPAVGAVMGPLAPIPVIAMGPIGIAVGLILTGIGVYFGSNWKNSVAKKIVKSFDDNDIDSKFRKGICEYWEQTEKAFDQAAAILDNEWEAYIKKLQGEVEEHDDDDIQRKIASLRRLVEFYDNILLLNADSANIATGQKYQGEI